MFEDVKAKLSETGCAYLKLKAIPGSAKTEVKGEMSDGTIKVAVAAPPEKGKANIELLRFLAAELGVPKGSLALVAGAGDRIKLIKIKR
jgi:uncharacterized protein (TIGR00251 family)